MSLHQTFDKIFYRCHHSLYSYLHSVTGSSFDSNAASILPAVISIEPFVSMNFPQNMVFSIGVVYISSPHPFDGLSQERLMLPNMIGVLRRDVGMKSYLIKYHEYTCQTTLYETQTSFNANMHSLLHVAATAAQT